MKKQQILVKISGALICAFSLFACTDWSDEHNQLSDPEKKEGWTLLFDGRSMEG